MFSKLGRHFPFFYILPIRIRTIVSLLANVIDEINVIIHLKLKKGQCFMDIGAHVGAYSVVASKLLGKNGVVIAVEPDPRNFEALLLNTRLMNNIIPCKVAIWNKNEYKSFYTSRSGALGSLKPIKNMENVIKVTCLTLDSLCQELKSRCNIDKISAVKIDIEGAELEALECGEEILKMINFILIEVHDYNKINKIINILNRYNFHIKTINSLKSGHGHYIIGNKNYENIK